MLPCFFKRKFFVFNRWWCVFCWVLCLVWNFEWPNWWDCLFHCLSWEVPRGLVTWLRPPPVQLAQQKSLRYSEGEIMQRTARKSGFLLKYRAQTTHPLSVCPVSTLQFSSGFLPILIWISQNPGSLQFPLQPFFSLVERTQKAWAHDRMACRNPIERGHEGFNIQTVPGFFSWTWVKCPSRWVGGRC